MLPWPGFPAPPAEAFGAHCIVLASLGGAYAADWFLSAIKAAVGPSLKSGGLSDRVVIVGRSDA